MNTQNQDYIIDQVGAETWEQVLEEFDGMSIYKIIEHLDMMFPSDDNQSLACLINDEVNNV